jgi:hypothetical protein
VAIALAAAFAIVSVQSVSIAQGRGLDSRLDARTSAEVLRIVDSARAVGIPTDPLLDKALEGATKHASHERIAAAVRGLAQRLGVARGVLGTGAPDADLVAAAGALYEGVTPSDLARLRDARGRAPLALPLVVLADLIARGVPTSTATSVIVDLAATGANDEAFVMLRHQVEQDISAGAPPAIAATTRARGTIYALPRPREGAAVAAEGSSPAGPKAKKPPPKTPPPD